MFGRLASRLAMFIVSHIALARRFRIVSFWSAALSSRISAASRSLGRVPGYERGILIRMDARLAFLFGSNPPIRRSPYRMGRRKCPRIRSGSRLRGLRIQLKFQTLSSPSFAQNRLSNGLGNVVPRGFGAPSVVAAKRHIARNDVRD